jgi:hypothetical protein
MKKLTWKKDKIFAIEVKTGLYSLVQLLDDCYCLFFNVFNHDNNWEGVELKESNILFCHAVTLQFLRRTNKFKTEGIKPIENYVYPSQWIHATGFQTIKIWENTSDERTFLIYGEEFLLVEKDIVNHRNNAISGIYKSQIKNLSNACDIDVSSFELTTIAIFPNLNERLYLCHLFNKNVDPQKELILKQAIPIEYKTYIDIISGEVLLTDLGYSNNSENV